MAFGDGPLHGGRTDRLHADELGFGGELLENRGYARSQPAAADGHQQVVDIEIGVFEYFQPHRPLPFHDQHVVERVHEGGLVHSLVFHRGVVGVVVGVAHKLDRHPFLAEHPDLLHLLGGRGRGHEDDALHTHFATGVGHALRVVPGAGADDALGKYLGRKVCHFVVRPPNLIGAHDLQILPLQINIGPKLLRQMQILHQRRVGRNAPQPLGG